MKKILFFLLPTVLLFNACEECDYLELRPQIVAYFQILDKTTSADLVFGSSPTLQLSDIQVTHVKGDERITRTIERVLPDSRADSLLSIGFIISLFSPALADFEYPDTTFINYSGVYPEDTLLIDYWYSDNDCEGSDDYPDNFH